MSAGAGGNRILGVNPSLLPFRSLPFPPLLSVMPQEAAAKSS